MSRLAVLWTQPSGYLLAGLEALEALGVRVLLSASAPAANAPFDLTARIGRLSSAFVVSGQGDGRQLLSAVEEFRPDALLVCGWQDPTRRQVAKQTAARPRVLFMDNQWHGRPKQRLGVLTRNRYLHPLFDRVLVPGDRQAAFARRLGYGPDRVQLGGYSADTSAFAYAGSAADRRAFAFVGRLVADKGVDVLAEAYREYRARTDDPWRLLVAGTGPLANQLQGSEGVEMLGFVQPQDLPAVLGRSSCLVLPSRFEPWGVVVHEATAAGLMVVVSDAVGSHPAFVSDLVNGAVIPPGDARSLTAALVRVGSWSHARATEASAVSRALSMRISPETWARAVMRICGLELEPDRAPDPAHGLS